MNILRGMLAAALVGIIAGPASGAFTCETVARSGQSDGNGGTFSRRFHTAVAVNGDGDTVFSARPEIGSDNLYFFSGDGGTKTILATAGAPAPGGVVYKTGKAFTDFGTNDFDDVVFKSRLFKASEGVFGRFGVGAIKKLAVVADASPCGGLFKAFPAISSRISNGGVAAFVGNANDGSTGAVTVTLATGVLGCAIDEGDVVEGREVCEILDVGLGDTGLVAVRAITKVDCGSGGAPLETILTATDLLALEGAPTPIAGTSYDSFDLEPSVMGSNVAFLASVTGSEDVNAVFVSNGATTVAIAEDDAAPDVGGSFAQLTDFALTSAGVFVNSKLKGKDTVVKTGIFSASEAAVVKTDAPPLDAFGAGSRYSTLQKKNAMSNDGETLAVLVKVRDTAAPKKKTGIVRCEN